MKRGITARRLTKALLQDGFLRDRIAGSHHIFTHADGRVVPVAFSHDSQTFPVGMLRKMAKLARWTEDDLRRHNFL